MTTNFEDLRQSGNWASYLGQLGWLVEETETQKVKIFIRKLPLVGSVAKIQRPSVIPPVEEVDEIAKKHRALFVKLEPALLSPPSSLLSDFEADAWPLSPTRTIHVDLAPSEEEIFEKFSKDARYSVRRAERNRVSTQLFSSLAPSDQRLEEFYKLLSETGRRKRFWVAPFVDLKAKTEAFKDKSALIFAYHNTEVVAGALILFHDQVAYYHHAASNLEGRKLLAPYLVVWETIKLAKKRGCHTLDLEGIYDPRYKIYKRFRKIGIFKKKFGGKEIEYPGSFIKYYNPIVRLVFKLTPMCK